MQTSFFQSILQIFSDNVFLQNAIIAILLMGIISGIIGSLLVSNKIVFVGGGVAHCAYGGIGVAIFFGLPILLCTTFSGIIVALCLAIAKERLKEHIDTFSAILWAFGMSIGVLLINLSSNANADIESYLFGSIISVDWELLEILFIFDIVIVVFSIVYYRYIVNISYDNEFCALRGIRVNVLNILIFLFIAVGIILSMQISGLILVLTILSIPAYMSSMIVKTLKSQMILSMIFSICFMLIGLYVSYRYNISPGASITLIGVCCIVVLYVLLGIKRFCNR